MVRLPTERGLVGVTALRDTVFVFGVATRTALRDVVVCVLTRWVMAPARVDAGVLNVRDAAKPSVAHNAQKTKIIPILLMFYTNVSKIPKFRASK